jgi:hypothetical protein
MSIIAATWAAVRPGPMSDLGQNRKCLRLRGMSVPPPESRRRQVALSGPFRAPKAEVAALLDHLVATAEHLASMVIRAVRLAAVLLRIAQNLRHADKGPAHL